MANYQILTDSCCDFTGQMYRDFDISYIPLTILQNGESHEDFTDEKGLKAFFDDLRKGAVIKTAAANPESWTAAMEPVLKEGKDLLVLAFSSGLSTTYQSAVIAAQELKERYPDRKVNVVDTLCASLGQGLLVWYAAQKRDAGMDLEELTAWVESHKLNLCHWFTVDDLMYLKRGGRVSAATALLGTMLQIKPVLHVDDEGHLINVSKARGRKASIEALAKKLGETGLPGENETVFICHGDCLEDAQYLEKLVRDNYGVKNVVIGYVGAVIGSHSGPGTLALFFLGEHR